MTEELRAIPGLAVREREPMARHTVWRAGGPVDLWVVGETEEALGAALKLLKAGGIRVRNWEGPHLLVKDSGVEGAYLRAGAVADGVKILENGLDVGALAWASVVASMAAREGFALPPVAGTALEAVRCGAWPTPAVWRVLRGGKGADVKEPGEAPVLRLRFELERGLPLRVKGAPRRGSGRVMADPKRGSAAELMVESGLVGVRLRKARLGLLETNSLINLGGATTQDLLTLIRMVQDRVKQQTGVELEPEFKPVGRRDG